MVLKQVVERLQIDAGEVAYPKANRGRAVSVGRAGAICRLIDQAEADTEACAQIGDRVAHGAASEQRARTVVLEPVREVLEFREVVARHHRARQSASRLIRLAALIARRD